MQLNVLIGDARTLLSDTIYFTPIKMVYIYWLIGIFKIEIVFFWVALNVNANF